LPPQASHAFPSMKNSAAILPQVGQLVTLQIVI
jgi:hypothetical protein